MKILLTNDDGVTADGLRAMQRALGGMEDAEVGVIAPHANRSAVARTFTMGPVWVEDDPFPDAVKGFSTNGTPVDCVRLAALNLLGFFPEVVVAGINHGVNLGSDIAYSGTVAAALEAMTLAGVPALAVSQQSRGGELHFFTDEEWDETDFEYSTAFVAQLLKILRDVPLPAGTMLNVNCPTGPPKGVRICRLGRRIYADPGLHLMEEDATRRHYLMHGRLDYLREPDIDFEAVAEGYIAVTPLRSDSTCDDSLEVLRDAGLDRLLAAT